MIDKITEAVRKDLLDRSTVGIVKYKTTLDQNQGDLRYWLQHAYEEALDHAQYLKRAIMEIDSGKPTVETNGLKCSVCGDFQYRTPGGASCKNGHGGADGY